jgi:ubiquitin-like 1-activating enzyme E1 A
MTSNIPDSATYAASSSSSSYSSTKTKTPTESDVYDRQIRLWGAEAQLKIRQSKVLYIHITGVSSEIIKNLVLAGIAATLCDPRPASILQDVGRCFFTPTQQQVQQQVQQHPSAKKIKFDSAAHAAQPLIEGLNPLLGSCPLLLKSVEELTEDDLKDFAVVVASQIPIAQAVRLSQIVTNQGHVLYVADCFGMRGAAMIDLGRHYQYRPEMGQKLGEPTLLKDYVPLSEMVLVPLHRAVNRFHKHPPPTWVMYRCLLEYHKQTSKWLGQYAVDEDTDTTRANLQEILKTNQVKLTEQQLDDLVVAGMAQVAPVCAVLGGIIGNEVIKIITGKGEPANNCLMLDGDACKAWSFLVKSIE